MKEQRTYKFYVASIVAIITLVFILMILSFFAGKTYYSTIDFNLNDNALEAVRLTTENSCVEEQLEITKLEAANEHLKDLMYRYNCEGNTIR